MASNRLDITKHTVKRGETADRNEVKAVEREDIRDVRKGSSTMREETG